MPVVGTAREPGLWCRPGGSLGTSAPQGSEMSGTDFPTMMGGAGDGPGPTSSRIESGTLLAHTYRVERSIGAGGMGEIYEAVNTITGAHAAIKAIRPELVSDETIARLFVREAEALKSIRDAAVVGYEGVFRDEIGRVFLAMEYVDGPSLAGLIRTRPLAVEEALRLGRRLARGLAAAHAVGVFHRDLSPDNILLPGGRLDDAVIIDFGIAKRQGASGPTLYGADRQGFTGKYAYASPEQAGAVVAPIDGRSDFYSLALVLVAAVLGRPLPMGHDPLTAVAARQRRPDLSAVPQALRAVVEPMLAPDPGDRPSQMAALLDRVERTDRAEAAVPAARPAAHPPRRSMSWLAWVGGAILLGAVGAVAYVLLEPLPPPPVPPPPSVTGGTPSASGARPATKPPSQPAGQVAPASPPGPKTEPPAGQAAQVDIPAVARLRELVGQPMIAPPQITLNRPDGVYRADRNDVVVARVSLPSGVGGFVYVDDFQEDGEVYHLLPEPKAPANQVPPGGSIQIGHEAATAGPHDRVWQIGAPYGRARIVVLVSASPLYEGLRPIGEKSEDYLAVLEKALPAAKLAGGLAMADLPIETQSGP